MKRLLMGIAIIDRGLGCFSGRAAAGICRPPGRPWTNRTRYNASPAIGHHRASQTCASGAQAGAEMGYNRPPALQKKIGSRPEQPRLR
jgi:hypothetical protein